MRDFLTQKKNSSNKINENLIISILLTAWMFNDVENITFSYIYVFLFNLLSIQYKILKVNKIKKFIFSRRLNHL